MTKFMPDVDQKMNRVIKELLKEKMSALILDLRHNTGGLMNEAIKIADRFLNQGLILRTRGPRSDQQEWYAAADRVYPNFKLAILIDDSTASSAEIVAGTLQDHRRAVVFGERSYGKGSVQEVVRLREGNGALKLTTAYYYLPSGRCLHRTRHNEADGDWGVEPTRKISLTPGTAKKLATYLAHHGE